MAPASWCYEHARQHKFLYIERTTLEMQFSSHGQQPSVDGYTASLNVRMKQLVYVCSAARSGSTFTDMFLGGHPAIASIGEINFISNAIAIDEPCSCGVGIRACGEWAKVFDEYALHHGFDPRQHPYRLGLWDAKPFNRIDTAHQTPSRAAMMRARKAWLYGREWLPDSLRKFVPIPPRLFRATGCKFRLAEAIAAAWHKSHVVDSSKNAREAVELWKLDPRRVRIILLTRDGRGVFLSRRNAGRSREASLRGWRDYYVRFVPLIERHVAAESVFRLKYEDLAGSPQTTVEALCRFLGLDFDPVMLDLSAKSRHMAAGNDTRFMATKGIRLDERWRADLSGAELAYFQQKAGWLNERLGYA